MRTIGNNVQLIGNLGKDPEVKEVSEGRKVAKMSLATSRTYTSKKTGKKVEDTQWHNLVVWGKRAETAGTYLKKGSRIAVDGSLRSHSYENKEGVKKYVTEVVVNDFKMLDTKKEK